MSQAIISMKSIKKRFGSFYALKGIDLDIYAGEIHALMGENGAGKSTLMKILAGSYKASEGEIYIDGEKTIIQNPQDALNAGISLIYQEINLSPNLTIAENIFMGREIAHKGFIDRKSMIEQTQKLLDRLNASFRAEQKAGELTIAEQQQVEIARALHRNSRVLVMDEPTAALSSRETEVLFERIKKLRNEGIAIIYISHRMGEIYELADRVTVLRDGASVGGLMRSELNADKLVAMMVGRPLTDLFERSRPESFGDIILKTDALTDKTGRVNAVSLNVKAGEIVGLSGLVGSGRTEFARLIFGADKASSGKIYLDGQEITIANPKKAMEHRIGYLPENRKEQGLFLLLSAKDNIIANNIAADSRFGVLNSQKGRRRAREVIERMRIRLSSMFVDVDGLSGGNQQKTLFARWAGNQPKLLLLDEPTRGVDVGAKADIYHSINELAGEGCAILLISSELPEIVGMCDRVYVMREGHMAGELELKDISQENIMQLATGAASV